MQYKLSFILLMFTHLIFGQSMTLEWNFFHPVKKQWIELGEKGSVQEALIESGELPDPFYGVNETKFSWIEEYDWEFKSILFIEDAQLSENYIELEFLSIDTYGKVYFNDELIYTSDNAFIPHRIQIKPFVKKGLNEVTVIITPPVKQLKEAYKKADYHLPAPNDVDDIAIAPYARKPQYQFGWDWSLRMNTIGFNKAAKVHSYNENRLINHSVNVTELSGDEAKIELFAEFAVKDSKEIIWETTLFGSENVTMDEGKVYRSEVLADPKLWWPSGRGEQFLYDDKFIFQSPDNQLIDASCFKFGVRTSELVTEADEWGTSYYFKINGERIFCKGANYIPQDIFPARVKDKDIIEMVETMAVSNYNMVRVWGGGYYPDDVFYETCDSLGIMVWQDLMFACAMYPGDDSFIENVSREFDYQIPRISAHPSVMLFNGNNEVEVAWGNWGFQIKYGLYGKSAKDIEKAYDRLFKKVAPEIVKANSSIPYIHTSPLSNWGKDEYYNHGSQHYWGVWHGKDPIEDFGKKIGRFNAEYGFQSFPEYNTLATFSEEKDWDINSEVMKEHQKSYVGNEMILKHAEKLYGEPENFKEFVYFSQLTQTMAVSIAVAGHRIDAPRCGGTLYWQMNDCWPVSSWSSIDYYGNWKALQYRIKEDYKDLALLAKYNSLNDVDYYFVSSLNDTIEKEIRCQISDLKGGVVSNETIRVQVNGQNSYRLDFQTLKKYIALNENIYFTFYWLDENDEKQNRSYDYTPIDREREEDVNVSIKLTELSVESKTALLEIENDSYVKDFWVTSKKIGVRYSKNFINLLPGKHVIEIEFKEIPDVKDFELQWR